jgi:hypothetical protein
MSYDLYLWKWRGGGGFRHHTPQLPEGRSASLRSWFHPDYGFVRLDYKNIDGSEIRLELERVVEP